MTVVTFSLCQVCTIKRRIEWGFKILGAFVGTDDYVLCQLRSKMSKIDRVTDLLIQYPRVQFRYCLPRKSHQQVIIDVALTGVDGQSRTSDEAVERPLQVRYDQKMAKYGQVAQRNNLRFIPAIFSHTGQIHEVFKNFVKEQVRHKLIAFEGEAKISRIRSYMNWWVKCIPAVIAKTASS